MAQLNQKGLQALIEPPGRYSYGRGLFFKTLGLGRAYSTYRYRFAGREREMSLGQHPELSLAEARVKHMAARRAVIFDKIDPLAERWSARSDLAKKGR